MDFAERLKKILDDIGMTEYKLAQLANLNKSTVYSIMAGKSRNPSQKTLEAIAKALDMSVSELLGEKPDIVVKQIDNDTGIGIGIKYIDEYSEDDIKLALEIIDLIRRHQS